MQLLNFQSISCVEKEVEAIKKDENAAAIILEYIIQPYFHVNVGRAPISVPHATHPQFIFICLGILQVCVGKEN
jgi:hypothetical protein